MKEIPILFSTPMVQAILEGRKTMTRRIVKPSLDESLHLNRDFVAEYGNGQLVKCPYGQPGDLLWVRESFGFYLDAFLFKADEPHIFKGIKYKPSIHMPKDFARIWLKVTSVRVEQLHDITEENAVKEGAKGIEIQNCTWYKDYRTENAHPHSKAVDSFRSLWLKINGHTSWDNNPWVWVIGYEVLSATGKPAKV